MNYLPTGHELLFKSPDDSRFSPTISSYVDSFQSMHLQSTESAGSYTGPESGCLAPGETSAGFTIMAPGLTLDQVNSASVYIQGGALGEIGYQGVQSASNAGNYGISNLPLINSDNLYSGSFRYELSWLDKDHTLVLDIDKNNELYDGIGNKGVLIIPDHTLTKVRFNIDWYLNGSVATVFAESGIATNTGTSITSNVIGHCAVDAISSSANIELRSDAAFTVESDFSFMLLIGYPS